MSFSLNLDLFLQAAPTGPQGLDLAADAIDDVIKKIDQEMELLQPYTFAFAGTIQEASFGGADSAANLALHYSRAHEVTWKTLTGVKKDLVAFQDACRDAKNEIVNADDDAATRHKRTTTAIDVLQDGSMTNYGSRDHRRAQQDQDTTLPDPVVAPEGGDA